MSDHPVAVITGASRGIGRAIALDLAQAGFDIVAIARTLESSRNKAGLEDLKPAIKGAGVDFLPLQADIADISSHEAIIQKIEKNYSRINLLVNNAGIAPDQRQDILKTSANSYDRIMSTNLRGPFFFTQLVAAKMIAANKTVNGSGGKIIFITSVSARLSSLNRAEYCISKAGLSMAASVFAHRLAEENINVYEVRPGIIKTDMTAPVAEKYDRLIQQGLIPLNRWGFPEDIARCVTSLARGDQDYATGSIIEISGGMNIQRL